MGYHTANFVPTLRHKIYPAIDETNPELSADGKVVFITGGGSGIGRQIAKSFLTAGAKGIFLAGRNETKLQDVVSELNDLQGSKQDKLSLRHGRCYRCGFRCVRFRKSQSSIRSYRCSYPECWLPWWSRFCIRLWPRWLLEDLWSQCQGSSYRR